MELTGWGRYPRVQAHAVYEPASSGEAARLLSIEDGPALIPRGSGRSYGDSALASHVLSSRYLDAFMAFDNDRGRLQCAAGLSLGEILAVIVPRNCFLPVLPGTAQVSLGGAIAADVHGKNHHRDGSFCDHVEALTLCLPGGDILRCSREENAPLFHASCGGMGLTGVILDAELRLSKIAGPGIRNRTLVTGNLEESLELLARHNDSHYVVAWVDCLSRGKDLGRGCLFLGEHDLAADQGLKHREGELAVPFSTPGLLLNRFSMGLFNSAVYWRQKMRSREQTVHYQRYFFPLDGIQHWNRLYGRQGLLQYQCLLPTASAVEGLRAILERVADSGRATPLNVLKKMGPGNDNLLSFPDAGFTLALDFKRNAATLALLDELDAVVSAHGGRLYLAKDARMSASMFRQGYPRWEEFVALKREIDPQNRLCSLQSTRLGLTAAQTGFEAA